ncbi:replication restart DNA helicase PriA [Desulfobotulus alkaliphilus]|uniref:Replication restart protein PriA n=1 Tax=Desulfobotulus alkaliphilus TaxID=622671 RepID=A0A562RMN0_9BACT|nr:primosomal protein N' [Desulfobotulus alkaliphilus]TWI70311.1 replication restart DNA helicase PriA [Desulfobotulus alkaliphilus]
MESKSFFIHVAVDAPLFSLFTYGVPHGLRDRILPGIRVLVPLGPRRITGYVIKVTDHAPEDIRIADILDVLDEAPFFPAEHLAFYQRMAAYYHHPPGETLSTALPAGINLSDKSMYALTPEGEKAESSHPQLSILQLLKNAPLSLQQIRLRDHGTTKKTMDLLCKEGLVEIRRIFRERQAKAKTRKSYAIAPEIQPPLSITPKRLALWEWLKKNGPADTSIIQQEMGNPASALRWLKEKALILEEEVRVFRDPLGDTVEADLPPKLNEEQKEVVQTVLTAMEGGFHRFLLHGVTGSGKTEIYLHLVDACLKKEKPAIVLVPEIALISQIAGRFRARFGERVAVLHSGLSKGERLDQWERILSGELKVVIGARSAVFAPVLNPGIIIVDEEHDGSYKQDTGLRYNGRDMAILRAQLENCAVLLGSATPSIQSYANAINGRFTLLRLTRRVNQRPLPAVTLVDLREMKHAAGVERYISRPLYGAMKTALEKGEQVLLFLNRRGYAGFPVCGSCGEIVKCRHCDISLTLHRKASAFLCHFCGFSMASSPLCPSCRAPEVRVLGMGTEKVEAAARYLFPEARILRMDQDTTAKKGQLIRMLRQIRSREVDILVGTQMVAKGHDFPGITLVGILNADLGLSFPDFRASERNFQTLAQVAGRAGRGDLSGRVILQTFNPDHYSIQTACSQDSEAFFREEIGTRRMLGYPPFSRMIQIRISGEKEEKVQEAAAKAADRAKAASSGRVRILGPAQSPIARMAGQFRHQILLMGTDSLCLNESAEAAVSVKVSGVRVLMDVDPYAML